MSPPATGARFSSFCIIIIIIAVTRFHFCTASHNHLTSPTAASARDECDECSICFQSLGPDPTQLACGHLFHPPCIGRWIREGSNGGTCPMCRSSLQSELAELLSQANAINTIGMDWDEANDVVGEEGDETVAEPAAAASLPVRNFMLPISQNVGLNVISGQTILWVVITTHNYSADLYSHDPDRGPARLLYRFRQGTNHHVANFDHSYYIQDGGQNLRLSDLLFQPRLQTEQLPTEPGILIPDHIPPTAQQLPPLTDNLHAAIESFTPQFVVILTIGDVATSLRSDERRPDQPAQIELPARTRRTFANLDHSHYVQENGERVYLVYELMRRILGDDLSEPHVLQIYRNLQ